MATDRTLAALAINPTKYRNDVTDVLTRIQTEMQYEYPRQAGALTYHVKAFAERADDERMQRLRLIHNPEALAKEFFRYHPGLDDIHDLLSAINDQLANLRFDGMRCLDLGDALTDLEDFMSAYNESPQRETDRRNEAAEALADARREDV